MEVLATYSKQKLYDAKDDIKRIIQGVTVKFEDDAFKVLVHPTYLEVACSSKSFPWLFFSELNKAARLWCAKVESSEPLFAAVEISANVCYINRFILLPQV